MQTSILPFLVFAIFSSAQAVGTDPFLNPDAFINRLGEASKHLRVDTRWKELQEKDIIQCALKMVGTIIRTDTIYPLPVSRPNPDFGPEVEMLGTVAFKDAGRMAGQGFYFARASQTSRSNQLNRVSSTTVLKQLSEAYAAYFLNRGFLFWKKDSQDYVIYPGVRLLNARLDDLRSKEEGSVSSLRYGDFDPSEEPSVLSRAKELAWHEKTLLPRTLINESMENAHFHYFWKVLPGYLMMPDSITKNARSRLDLLVSLYDDETLSNNAGFREKILALMGKELEEFESIALELASVAAHNTGTTLMSGLWHTLARGVVGNYDLGQDILRSGSIGSSLDESEEEHLKKAIKERAHSGSTGKSWALECAGALWITLTGDSELKIQNLKRSILGGDELDQASSRQSGGGIRSLAPFIISTIPLIQ